MIKTTPKWVYYQGEQVLLAEDSDEAYMGACEYLNEIEDNVPVKLNLRDLPNGYAVQWMWLN